MAWKGINVVIKVACVGNPCNTILRNLVRVLVYITKCVSLCMGFDGKHTSRPDLVLVSMPIIPSVCPN